MAQTTYSFLSVNATLLGAGGAPNIGNGAMVSEEGITIEAVEDKNVMTIGADGKGQHSLIASAASTLTVRLLKTAPANATLMAMYNLQTNAPSFHGQNVLTVTDSNRNDIISGLQVAFKKAPTITYAKEGGMMEWTFDVVSTTRVLGGF